MMHSILKDVIATAKLADKLQGTNPKLTRIDAIKLAQKTETEEKSN